MVPRCIILTFQYIIKTDDLVFLDDFAHHPVEIGALLETIRLLYPKKNLTLIFQPHTYTRTRDFVTGFANILNIYS